MSEIVRKGKEFVGYEYKEISVPEYLSSLYLDAYPCFGWETDSHLVEKKDEKIKSGYVDVRFKRDRKIINKAELTRLQRNFDGCIDELKTLERSKTAVPLAAALIIGIIGTVFMALSTFAVTAKVPNVLMCIIFAIPGFIGWILPIFIYRNMVSAKKRKLDPLIEQKYEEIYDICEKGNHLLF